MAMHVTGDKCPSCKKKGLVVGGINPLTEEPLIFRPKGWLVDRLEVKRAVCPNCGYIVMALSAQSLERLNKILMDERHKETVTYHSKSKARARRKRPPRPSDPDRS